MEGLGSLRGVSGGAVGAGGFVVGDGAAGGDMICRRTGRGTPVVVVSRQDGGSPYGCAGARPSRCRQDGGFPCGRAGARLSHKVAKYSSAGAVMSRDCYIIFTIFFTV